MSKLAYKSILAIVLFSFLSAGCLFLYLNRVEAQIPSIFAECNETRPREYHSLRPYQANASCSTYDTNFATFCGNDLTIGDTIEVKYPGTSALSCITSGNSVFCDYSVKVDKTVTIDLSDADLPIMGNTGDDDEVINYENRKDNDTFTDAFKMSEYVSWYLNGATNSKEYYNKTDDYSSVNSSGVIEKLLPRQIQEYTRVKTIENAKITRHNQVVVCSLLGKPVDCYFDNIVKAIFDKEWRLTDWNGTFAFNKFLNDAIKLFAELIPKSLNLGEKEIKDIWLEQSPWTSKKPPFPWQNNPATGEPFDEITYRKAYNEWQGKYCIIVPGFNYLICLNNLLVPDKVANLFPYIPLSSTEDVEGEILVDKVSSATNTQQTGVVLTDVTFDGSEPAKLYFSHLEESDQLGSLLQDTFVPKDATKAGDPTNIDTSSATCKTVEVRSNAGDDLFATELKGTLHYVANFTCQFDKEPPQSELETCSGNSGLCVPDSWTCAPGAILPDGGCKEGYKCGSYGMCAQPVQTCTKDVYIKLSTQSKIPVIDDVWSRLVAGPMSVVKKIFPKTNSGGLGTLLDIPGSTNISYKGTDVDITQSTTDLKIPHVGGISEYFLNGIQTALRPKGYGKPITFGKTIPIPGECSIDEIPPGLCDGSVFSKYSPPSQTTFMGNSYFNYILPLLTPELQAVYKEAERQTGVPCEVLAGIHFREGSNDPNKSLQNGGALEGCLVDSAIQAAEELKAKVGGTIASWNDLITALAWYNGAGNSNCSANPPTEYSGPCPPPDGIDHNYVMNFLDPQHLVMYIIYCRDHEICYPYSADSRPGALTVATEFYNHE